MPDGGLILPPGLRLAGGRRELDLADPINRGLVAFWPLDETHRQAAEDIGPRRWRLSSSTPPTRIVGPRGRATNFAGASSQHLQNSGFVWPGGPSAAISAWINVPGSYNGSPYDFGGGRSLPSGNAFYGHLPYGDNNAYFYYGAVASGEISTSLASYLNQWIHIAWAVRPGRKAIWINGRLATESGTTSAAVAAGTNAYIGFSGASSMYHQGAMRLFRLRTAAWTDAEVRRLYRDEWAGTVDLAERLWVPVRSASLATISGAASPTLSAPTLSAAGSVLIFGYSLPTLSVPTAAATGALEISGFSVPVFNAPTLVATGLREINGFSVPVFDAPTLAATGELSLSGVGSITLSAPTASATGTISLTGALAVTLPDAVLSASGSAGSPIVGSAAVALDATTLVASGTLALTGAASATLQAPAIYATGYNGTIVNSIVLVWDGVRIT